MDQNLMQIHINRDGQQMGPFTMEQVQEYLAQGSLLPTDTAWHGGLQGWLPLSQIVPQPAPPVSATPAPVGATVVPGQGAGAVTAAPSGGSKKLLIGVGAGVGALAILAAVWFFFIREAGSKAPSTEVASSAKGPAKAVKKKGPEEEKEEVSTLKPILPTPPAAKTNAKPVQPHILVSPSHDLRTIIERANNNTVIKLTAGTYYLRALKPFAQGILIQNKRGLTISGAGRDKTIIKLAPDVDVGFFIGSNVVGLKIENLHIQGTPPLKTNTAGIGNSSSNTNTRNIILTNLKVDHVAIGIFLGTNTGVIRDVRITNNIVSHTVGTEAGWGYGIHTRKIGNVLIAHNFIEHATRHSIYVRESPPNQR